MDYADLQTSAQNALAMQDANGAALVNALLPQAITYAESRLFRELDMVATRTSDFSQRTFPNERTVLIPPQFLVIEEASLIVGGAPGSPGASRIPMLRTDIAVLDLIWPIETQGAMPVPFETYYAIYDQNAPPGANPQSPQSASQIRIAPTPLQSYQVEFRGTAAPLPLSAENATNLFSTLVPDLYFALVMVFLSGSFGDYGAASDDPQQAVSWEKQYQDLKAGMDLMTLRQKAASAGWTAYFPAQGNLPRGGAPAPVPP